MTSNTQRLDQIRELLSAHPQGLSVTEIAAALGVNKNSTGRSLDTLYAAGEIRMRRFGMAKLYTSAARMPLSAMMSLPSDLILIVDEDLVITFINDQFLTLLDLTRDQVVNRHITTIRGVAPDMEGLEAAFVAAAEKGEAREMVRFSEEDRIFLRRCVPVTLESGAAGTAMIMEDLTAQIRAEQALHERENQLTDIIENLQDIYYQIDQEDIMIYANQQILPMLGYDSMDQVLGRPAISFWAEPDKRKKFENLVLKRGAINDFETTLVRGDGPLIPVSVSSHLRLTSDGEILGLGGTIRDITRRKENEEKIRILSAHNRAMIEANLDPIASVDRDGTITDVNEAVVAITGYPREDLIGTPFNRYFADQTMARQVFGEVIFSGQVRNRYVEVLHADGCRTPALLNAALCRDGDGTIIGILASLRDITDQQRMDRDLARNEGLLQMMAAVFVYSAQSIAIEYPDGRFAYANPALCRMLGYTEKELKALDWSADLTPREWWEMETRVLERLSQTGESQKYRKELLHQDGRRMPVELVAHLVRETSDLPLCYCIFITDISEELRAEQQQTACELRFQYMVNAAPIGAWATDSAGRAVLVNRPLARLLGHSIEELEGRLAVEVFKQAGLGEEHLLGDKLARGEENVPVTIHQKDGGVVEALLTTAPVTNQQGQFQGMIGFMVDRTREREQEQVLFEAKRRFSAMIDQVPLMALQFDESGALVSCNDPLIARTGWTRNHVLGRDWHLHLVPEETGDLGLTLRDLVTRRGDRRDWTGPVLTADGRVLQVGWTCLVLYDSRQRFAGLICLGEDVSDHCRLAGLLSKTGEQSQHLVESIPYPTVLIDADWTITQINREFSAVLQYMVPKRPKKLSLLSIFSPECRPAVTALLNREEAANETCTAVREDGEQISVVVRAGPSGGDAPRVLVLITGQNTRKIS